MPGVDIKRDDMVKVLQGKDRGKEGRVVRVLPREGRVMVDGVALAKKHMRASGKRSTGGQQLQQGGIIDAETFIDISNVQVVCKSCGKPTRVGHRTEATSRSGSVADASRSSEHDGRLLTQDEGQVPGRAHPPAHAGARSEERHAGAPVREGRHQHGRG